MDILVFKKNFEEKFPAGKLAEVTAEYEKAEARHVVDPCPDVHGLTSVKKQLLLNLAVSCMAPGECYMEVGTYAGKTLISALSGNDRRAYACENFSQYKDSNSAELLTNNLSKYGMKDRVVFFNADFREAFRKDRITSPIGVYFYDGAHDEKSQYEGIKLAEPYLADAALVFVDDWRYAPDSLSGAEKGTLRAILESRHHWQMLHNLPARFNGDHAMWWNGVGVFQFSR